MDQGTIFIGFFLTVLFIGVALWHIRENTKLESSLLERTDEQTTKWIMHFAWSRTLQLLAALGCVVVIFMNYDKQLIESRENLNKLTEAIERKNQLEAKSALATDNKNKLTKKDLKVPAENPVVAATLQTAMQEHLPSGPTVTLPPTAPITQPQPPAVQQQRLPLANIPATDVPDQAITVIQPSNMTQGTIPAVNSAIAPSAGITATAPVDTTPAPLRRNAKSEAIEALYDPEKNQTDKQSGLDDIKKRYEDIIVIYLFLKKCNKTQPNDLSIINNALTQEVTAVNASDKFQSDIMTAARGSYNEIYAKSSCDGKSIATLTDQYNNYIDILGQNYPMQ